MTADERSTEERLRTQVERIRAAVAARYGSAEDAPDLNFTAPRLDEVARLATVNAHWGIASDAPVVGPLVVYTRRVVRLMLRWYINPLVEQQNAFNRSTVRALFDLQLEHDELRAELARLRQEPAE